MLGVKWRNDSDSLEQPHSRVKFQWKIENFPSLPRKEDVFYESPEFACSLLTWCLRLYPDGESAHSSKGWIGLYLELCSNYLVSNIQFVAGIQNTEGTVQFQKGCRIVATSKRRPEGWIKFLSRDVLEERKHDFFPNGTLTICVSLDYEIPKEFMCNQAPEKIGRVIIEGQLKSKSRLKGRRRAIEDGENETTSIEEIRKKRKKEQEFKGADRLIQNLYSLLQNEWGSDVILKNADHEFRAHRALLGTRSPVFASMFHHDMTEKNASCVDISDCSTEGFKVFLQFLYTGTADAMSTATVFDLYYIADKYQVDDLKAGCIEFLKNTLSVDTFCDVIALSLRLRQSDLQNAATRFFCSNMKGIIKTVSWQKYITENPKHANELIIKAVNA